ncbi:MAG: radical SAM protein [Clostridiales bacterium]|nr:radical SAM protein [Clostridiales bacterium]
MQKSNIAVFIPHIGCPNKCSFCNQNEITGINSAPTPADVRRAVETSIKKTGAGVCELAFFGGSFTAIDRGYMLSLLQAAEPYVKSGGITGIRCSTRPDAIDVQTLLLLKQYGVTSIELGAQSMDDEVLRLNFRGHTSADVQNAARLIKSYDFELGLQMMTDLYASSEEKDLQTAKKIVEILPATARIYPTVILKGTYLETLYNKGVYRPLPISERARVAANIAFMFQKKGINVIRIGLHSSESIKENALGNTFHDAFGEMVASQIMQKRIASQYEPGKYYVNINERSVSKLVGQKRENIMSLRSMGYDLEIVVNNEIDVDELQLIKKADTVQLPIA